MPVLTKARQSLVDQQLCLLDHDAQEYSRGLCQRCLEAARNAIARGEITEQELVNRGLMLPAKTRGRRSKNPLAALIEKQRAKNKNK